MNKKRRSEIAVVCHDLLAQAIDRLDDVKFNEEMAYDNLPENFQDSERGETMLENIEVLDEVNCKLEEAKDIVEEVIELLSDL